MATEIDPNGEFEQAYAEVAGVPPDAVPRDSLWQPEKDVAVKRRSEIDDFAARMKEAAQRSLRDYLPTHLVYAPNILEMKAEMERMQAELMRILSSEESSLLRYRNYYCQGDDAIKRHAWIVADARLAEVSVLRRLLVEAGVLFSAREVIGGAALAKEDE